MAQPGPGRFGWMLLVAACANVGPTVYSTPPPPPPPEQKLLFPFPDYTARLGGHGHPAYGYGGYGLDFVARADTDGDGHDDRSLAGVIDGKLIVRDARSGALAAIPIDGSTASVIASGVPEGALVAGDARGIYWAAPDGSVWQAPDRRLAACAGIPRFLLVDATAIHVFASTQRSPYDGGLALWAIPRAGGQVRPITELPGRDGVPTRRPVDGGDAFYFAAGRNVMRLSKRGELSHLADVPAKQADMASFGEKATVGVVLVDAGFVYVKGFPSLMRVPVEGGALVAVTDEIQNDPFAMWAIGDHLYLHQRGDLHVVPRAGGTWREVASVPGPVHDVFERAGKLYVLNDVSLVRVDPIVEPEQRVNESELWDLMALASRGRNLYYTVSRSEPEIWSVPRKGGEPRLVMKTPDLAAAPVFDGDFVYLRDQDGGVLRAPVGGGATTVLTRSPPAVSAEREYWESGEDLLPQTLGVDAGFVYWLNPEQGALMRVPKTGGAVQAAAQALPSPMKLAVGDGFAVVEATPKPGKWALLHIPLAPAGPARPLAAGDDPIPFAVVGRDVRWTIGDKAFGQTAGGGPFAIPLSPYSRGIRFSDLAFRGNTLVLAGEHGVHSESPGRDAVRVIGAGHMGPTMLIVDDDAVTFVEMGYTLRHKSQLTRADCCHIWTARR
jgi:hypothetical protein